MDNNLICMTDPVGCLTMINPTFIFTAKISGFAFFGMAMNPAKYYFFQPPQIIGCKYPDQRVHLLVDWLPQTSLEYGHHKGTNLTKSNRLKVLEEKTSFCASEVIVNQLDETATLPALEMLVIF